MTSASTSGEVTAAALVAMDAADAVRRAGGWMEHSGLGRVFGLQNGDWEIIVGGGPDAHARATLSINVMRPVGQGRQRVLGAMVRAGDLHVTDVPLYLPGWWTRELSWHAAGEVDPGVRILQGMAVETALRLWGRRASLVVGGVEFPVEAVAAQRLMLPFLAARACGGSGRCTMMVAKGHSANCRLLAIDGSPTEMSARVEDALATWEVRSSVHGRLEVVPRLSPLIDLLQHRCFRDAAGWEMPDPDLAVPLCELTE